MTPDQEAILKATHEAVQAIQQLLRGYDEKGGFIADFEEHKQKDEAFRAKFYAFRLSVIVTGALFFGGTGFGFARILELLR